MDDDLLIEFVNESREHLATIEADLLSIEESGADMDEVLVNKVFRAAHSIKGGSGFFGLTRVKELAHKAETVLDMLRSRKMIANAEVTNVLLAAFDRLRDMVNHAAESEQMEIADLVTGLTQLASSYLPAAQKPALEAQAALTAPGMSGTVLIPQTDLDRIRRCGQYLYWVDCDLVHDIERQGKTVLSLFHDLTTQGEIVDCVIDYDAVGTLDGPVGNRLPLRLLYATVVIPDRISGLFDTIPRERIHLAVEPSPAAAVPSAGAEEKGPAPRRAPRKKGPAKAAAAPAEEPPAEAAAAAPPEGPEPKPSAAPAAPPPAALKGPESATHPAPADETLRVHVGLLETLMNLAGELVLSRNQLRAAVLQNNPQSLAAADQRIHQVTGELQDVIMQTRLQPIGNVFAKFPRVVRDLSMTLGKEIQLDIQGREVALDKTLIEGLSDPLTHMVRNAVDHGIESAEERIRAGKRPAGAVRIEARHEAGQVVVEIADDGKGIDPGKVAAAAISKGLITAEKVQGLSDRDRQALIFLPGLSTARQVSDISGRGVGMDVVKTNLDRLGGQVEIVSEVGRGSLFRIKLPLTLAIIPSLLVSVEEERFAIPQANIEELLRIRSEEVKHRIEVVGDTEVLLLRERILPLIRFSDLLGLIPSYIDPATGRRAPDRRGNLADPRSPRRALLSQAGAASDSQPQKHEPDRRQSSGRRESAASVLEIAVVTTGTMSYGLVVGSFHDTEEIVVKPLGRRLKHLREYSGATILGDGTVALILDIAGVAAKAGLTSMAGSARATQLAARAEDERLQDVLSLLTFHNGSGLPCALSLDLVQRIERIAPEQIERLGGRRTMRYRGGSLPLVALSDCARVPSVEEFRDLAVLVTSVNGREIGLLGAMPVDTVETRAAIDAITHCQPGIAGSAQIHNRTTLMVDLFELVDVLHPEWSEKQSSAGKAAGSGESRAVLLAEDSDFFRGQVKRFLEEGGFTVLDAPDGEAAWELLLKNLSKVEVVVTDIEMPRLNGLELAARIRADQRTSRLPVIAVTSLAGEEDAAKGRSAGIDDYQIKLDRDRLLASVRSYMSA